METAEYSVPTPEVSTPPAEGAGTNEPLPNPALPAGYTEEELFVSGTATSFQPVDTPDDGEWTVELDDEADYRTRVIVRRPPPEQFSGTVIVEWFNVSAIESSPGLGVPLRGDRPGGPCLRRGERAGPGRRRR